MRLFILITFSWYFILSSALAQPIDSLQLKNQAKDRIYSDVFQHPIDVKERIRVHRQTAEHLATSILTFGEILKEIPQLERYKKLTTREIKLLEVGGKIGRLYSVILALERDIKMAREGKWVLIRSHTFEEAFRIALEDIPTWYTQLGKKLPALNPKLIKGFTFLDGIQEFVTGGAKQRGKGQIEIEILTHYLDSLNSFAWTGLGLAVCAGNTSCASAYQAIGTQTAKIVRERTQGFFDKTVLAWRRQGEKLVTEYLNQQKQRIRLGLPPLRISEVYKVHELKKNGLTDNQIRQLDEAVSQAESHQKLPELNPYVAMPKTEPSLNVPSQPDNLTSHTKPADPARVGTVKDLSPIELARVIERAKLSEAVYSDNIESYPKPESKQDVWQKIDHGEFSSGLNWALFQRVGNNGRVELVLAFGGTEDLRDWGANLSQVFNVPAQYLEALELTKTLLANVDKRKNVFLTVTGHSLAGSIAQFISFLTGVRAYVFNSAPVWVGWKFFPTPLIAKARAVLAWSNITNIYDPAEGFHLFPSGIHLGGRFEVNPAPGTPGIHPSGVPKPVPTNLKELVLGEIKIFTEHFITRHGIDSVIKGLEYIQAYGHTAISSKKLRMEKNNQKIAIALSGSQLPSFSNSSVFYEGQSWYRIQLPGRSESVSVLDGRGLQVQTIIQEVSSKAKELGLPQGETIVVGGNPGTAEFADVVTALKAKGFGVEEVSTEGLDFDEAVKTIAARAHEIGSQVGVLVGNANEELLKENIEEENKCPKDKPNCVPTPGIKDEAEYDSLEPPFFPFDDCIRNPEECYSAILRVEGPGKGGGGPGGGGGRCPDGSLPPCDDPPPSPGGGDDDDAPPRCPPYCGDGGGGTIERESTSRPGHEKFVPQSFPDWGKFEFEPFERRSRSFLDVQREAGKGNGIPDPGPLISK